MYQELLIWVLCWISFDSFFYTNSFQITSYSIAVIWSQVFWHWNNKNVTDLSVVEIQKRFSHNFGSPVGRTHYWQRRGTDAIQTERGHNVLICYNELMSQTALPEGIRLLKQLQKLIAHMVVKISIHTKSFKTL